jgi:hypothetical protein
MLRAGNLSNKFQKRTLRVLYGQTQAYPYAAFWTRPSAPRMDRSLTATGRRGFCEPDSWRRGLHLQERPLPGTVVTLVPGTDKVKVANWSTHQRHDLEQPFGLLANFVGGELDEVGDERRGRRLALRPGRRLRGSGSGLRHRRLSATNAGGNPAVRGTDGRLTTTAPDTWGPASSRTSSGHRHQRILIDLKV